MKYTINEKVFPEKLSELRRSVGWNCMEKNLSNPRLKNFLDIACYDGDCLVGYVCAVSNGVTDAYIQDLMVAPDYQRKGIGTELMRRAIEYLKDSGIYMISVIYGTDELRSFYEKFGFYTMLCGQIENGGGE